MTLAEIRSKLVAIDPDIRHHYSTESSRDYTYWSEITRLPLTADGVHDEGWRFYVHRFTRNEFDPIARQIFDALDEDPRFAVREDRDFEPDTGYIHHIFTCEGY